MTRRVAWINLALDHLYISVKLVWIWIPDKFYITPERVSSHLYSWEGVYLILIFLKHLWQLLHFLSI